MDLIVLIVLGALIAPIVALANLYSRVGNLEEQIASLLGKTTVRPQVEGTEQAPAPSATYVSPAAQPAVSYTPQAQVAVGPNQFIEWLKKDFLMKVGALFLLMAFGWFVSYAFMNNWIGPAGRILLGILAGIVFLILGIWRIRIREHQGAVFTVLGSSIIILTVYAARELYDFFTPVSALAIMFLSVVFVAFVSLRYRRESLALAGLVLACIAPYLTSSPVPFVVEQFVYLLMVVVGTLWIVLYTEWRNLTAVALLIVFLETLPYIGTQEKFFVLLCVFLFVAIFFIANIAGILRVRGAALSQAHLFTAFGTAVFLILWVFSVAPKEWQSLLFVAWMLVFSLGAYIVYRSTDNHVPFYVYGGTSLALLGAATTAELSGTVLVIAYTFEIAVVTVVAKIARLPHAAVSALSLLFGLPILLSFESMVSPAWRSGFLHADFFVLVILMLTLTIVGLLLHERGKEEGVPEAENLQGAALMIFGGLYGLALIWLVLHAVMEYDLGTMVTFTIYTILGLFLSFRGKAMEKKSLVTAGRVLVGFVVLRLLLVDVWDMELSGRIITFIVIGVLLLSTAFMGKKHQEGISQSV